MAKSITRPGIALRPAQEQALAYRGGRLAITAAPGAGKTFILTQLVVHLVADLEVRADEILILTYMRSAALTFRTRVASELARRNLSARGLTTCTIHAFCQRILRQDMGRLDPAGDDASTTAGFRLLTEPEQYAVLRRGMAAFLADRQRFDAFFGRLGDRDLESAIRESVETAKRCISAAKQTRQPLANLARTLPAMPEVAFLAAHYADTQRADLTLDFDDLLVSAVNRLRGDPGLLGHYRRTLRFLLEDEAQDSTPVQNELLELLAGPEGNLVRVGDPNQAIMSSFTNSTPGLFREFCRQVPIIAMCESSRSAEPVIGLANALVRLTESHADPSLRATFAGEPIAPATAGPRNPDPLPDVLRWRQFADRDEEFARVAEEVRRHLRERPSDTCAILCVTNSMLRNAEGAGFLPAVRGLGLPVFGDASDGEPDGQVLESLRLLFRALVSALKGDQTLSESIAALAAAWARAAGLRIKPSAFGRAFALVGAERLVFPSGRLRPARPPEVDEAVYEFLLSATEAVERLSGMAGLPIGELLLASADAVAPGDAEALAVAAKLGRLVKKQGQEGLRPGRQAVRDAWALLEDLALTGKGAKLLAEVAETRAPGAGQVVITTLHKSKGAEYDAVWIPNLGYAMRGGKSHFPWETKEVALFDEAVIKAERAARGEAADAAALEAHRREIVAERLRLLYVGITRAKRKLTLSGYAFGKEPVAPAHIAALERECNR
jgi:DNA helicase-2/ATP-dependent DNA helicase PcrA